MNFKKITFILCAFIFLSAERNANAQIATFNYSGAITTFTVPCGVTQVTMTAIGATGGVISTYTVVGGKGAEMIGTFVVVPGSTMNILVGGAGGNGAGGGGGGGGTFVTTSLNAPLLIAGGGGGTCPNSNGYINVGIDAVTSNNGVNGYSTLGGSPNNYGVGGVGGNGATNFGVSNGPCGGNGGGLLTNGQNYSCCVNTFGYGFDNGGAGGLSGCGQGGVGGFGGGGGGGFTGGGGGGGYGGGGGAWNIPTNGGGGGSYNGGSSQNNTAAFNAGGNGQVIITWTVPAAPSVVGNIVSNELCNGGNNASASETVTGGSSPFTYLWTPTAKTTATATGLTVGTYTIKVTDNCGNSASASVSITQPAIVAVTTTVTNVSCNAGSNGSASSTVTGGTGAYTYSWTGGGTNSTESGLTAGTYTVTVTDHNGCTGTASATITQPAVLSVAASTTTNVLCNGGNTGAASSTVSGGTSAYTYLWLPSGGTNSTASGLTAGTYVLSVSDKNGCTGTATATITQPAAISLTSASTPDNGSGNGTATVTASGGTGPYNYLWTPSGKTTAAISGESKGSYCCKVTDANGCKDSTCVTIKSTAGVDGITSNSGEIVVYPNPNNGQFTIKSSVGGASTVEIYNVLGEKVFTRSLSTTEGTNTIDISNQSTGVYLYRVISVTGDLLGEGKISLQK